MKNQKIILLSVSALFFSACVPLAAAPTVTVTPTDTLVPTDTPTNTPDPTPDLAATESARATEQAASILGIISAELSALGFPAEGQLVWVQEELTEIKVNSQNFDGEPEKLEIQDPVGDFAMSVDVTWETDTGFSGCGIVFRAQDDFERGKQIRLFTVRLSGLPLWNFSLYRYGALQADLGLKSNSAIRNGQNSTNHYVLITQDSTVYLYANDTRIASTTLPADLVEGGFGFFAWEDSGITTCTFENGWVLEYPQ